MYLRGISTLTAISALGLVLSPSNGVAQEKSLKQQIQGPWSLAACNSTNAKGEKAPYCANNPKGILILAGNLNYAWTVIAGGRKDTDAPGVADAFGTWAVNEADKTIAFHVVSSIDPANEGRDYNYKMNISLNGEEMRVTATLNNGAHFDVTYRRFK
jgi:hypothetical protein